MRSLRYYIDLIREGELIEPTVTNKTVNKLDNYKLLKFLHKNTDDPKSGAYAYARDVDPHQVRLTSYKPVIVDEDPKLLYYQAIAPLMGENPYVPNVYEITLVQGKNQPSNRQKPAYKLQKLVKYNDVPALSMGATCIPIIKSFVDANTSKFPDQWLSGMYNSLKNNFEKFGQEIFSGSVEDPIGDSPPYIVDSNSISGFKLQCLDTVLSCIEYSRPTTDEKLYEVMKLIGELKQKYKFHKDLHLYNVMFRPIGAGGYQLVITDPLAD